MNLEKRYRRAPVRSGFFWLRNLFWLAGLTLLFLTGTLAAQSYTPPATQRQDIILDANWRFIQSDAGTNAANLGFNDSSWTNLNLPHTWDIPDGQDGPSTTYYEGIGWYRSWFTVAGTNAGLHFFLKFDGAFLVADVWVNGAYLGEHQGGFAAFVFDVTTNLKAGTTNLIAVKLNNAVNGNIPPIEGDFTHWGGIYRDVHLLVTDPVQISPLDFGSPGVYLMPTNVSASSAGLQVTTVLANTSPAATNVMLRTVITDAATNLVIALTNWVLLPAAGVSNVVANTLIPNPHLWNGLSDPYLYQAFVEVWKGTKVADLVAQPLGFRFFQMDPTHGFYLNGAPYDLHGVSLHQDWLNCGWALTNAQRDTNFLFIKQIGATAIRLPHYQHHDYEYTLADRNGVIVWSEVPNIESAPANTTNIVQQLHEMIHQVFNHPSVVCWGLYNEIVAGNGSTNVIGQEAAAAAADDPTRPTTAASNVADNDPTTLGTAVIGFNEYYGWYETPINGLAAWMDAAHAAYPARPTGLSEYGAGGSIYQHSDNPVWPVTDDGPFHPEEWQDLVHETNWAIIQARPYLWTKFVWNLFDFASDTRDEGDTPGRNDKGLVTYDRQTRKDVFYFYQANWTTNPMVYLTGHTFTNHLTNFITAKAYANCATVQLYLNGVSQGTVASTNCVFHWPVQLVYGTNYVLAVGTRGGIQVTDSLVWIVQLPAPNAPTGLSAAAGNNQVALTWNASSGATSYNVGRSTTSGSGYATIASPVAANYTDTTAANGTTYYYVVAAVNGEGTSANCSQVAATPTSGTGGNPNHLLVNPGFELPGTGKISTGFATVTGWANAGATYTDTGVETNPPPHSGVYSAYCKGGDSGAYQIANYQMNAGDIITLTWWAEHSGGSGSSTQAVSLVSASALDAAYTAATTLASNNAALNGYGSTAGPWAQYTLTYQATATDAGRFVGVYFNNATPGNWTGFDDFSLAATPQLPSPWATADIGAVGVAGGATDVNGLFTIKGSGADIWGTADAFRYVYQPASGNASIQAEVLSVQNTAPWAKAGVMFRETTNANSTYAIMFLAPVTASTTNGVAFQERVATGGSANSLATVPGVQAPYWVRLTRTGNSFVGAYSANGTAWTALATNMITMATNAYIGLPVCSVSNSVLNTATFTNVIATP